MSAFEPAPALPDSIRALLPFERASYRIRHGLAAGRQISFIDHGPRDGPVVLLQHGNPTWGFLWRKVIAELPGMRCLAPDLLGFGASDSLAKISDHSLELHVDSIAEWVEALGIEKLILVGQDWGGPVLTGVGARLGERVAGLILANTSVLLPRRPRGAAFHRFARLPLLSDLVFRGFGFPQNLLHRVQGDPTSIRGPVADAYRLPLRGYRRRAAPLALARMVPEGPEHPSVPGLRRGEAWARSFQGPTALVWGLRDPILGPALAKHEAAFPRASVRRTEAGHFLQEEVPETIAEAIREVVAVARENAVARGNVGSR